ncbi:arylamine N-acetyltransferase [Flavitalea sp. BT771]|uniref:arylamine N-acetyltransferase family protein n=1 Tax=Flavitalea sp. BT771 TaxID=3063329 RepID=UPI0026E320C8|nr:arylamine N-acetyltransferase [Flavitalea sp. BT771]MDO6432316.1 arylamine N-acetyltransferase [Flavitalea sp. BT771]MDV6221226.1 arylamine N-acetyltransferase [Flavitalea sp. BT771]
MDIRGYLKRINFNDVVYTDLSTLESLQQQHVLNIPFETLDIHNHIPIILRVDSLYQKVILDRRGGYCYELNTLFHRLLSLCGFKVHMIAGRLLHGHGYGRDFEHMALIVELDGKKWLIDVGYGDFSLRPLAIAPGEVQRDGRTFYQIMEHINVDGHEYMGVAKWNDSKQAFKIEYIFTLTTRHLHEFAEMNHFHQTSRESHFARSLIVSLPIPDGRISMINNKLIRTVDGKKQVKQILNEDHRNEILEKYFHMDMVYLV